MFPVIGTLVIPGLAMALIAGPLAAVLVLALAFIVLVVVAATGEQLRRTAAREWEERRRAHEASRMTRPRAAA